MERAEVQRLVTELEESVMSDGFDGYFFNSSDNPALALRALEAVGALRTAEIVRRACARFPGGAPPDEKFERQEVLLNVVSPDGDAFEQEDQDFFAYPDDLQALVAVYSGPS